MVGPTSDLNSARGNHISGNPPATAAEARNVQASNPSILTISNQLNLVTLEESTAEPSSLSSTAPNGVRTNEEQAKTQVDTSTGVVPNQTPMLSKAASRRRNTWTSVPISSQSTKTVMRL